MPPYQVSRLWWREMMIGKPIIEMCFDEDALRRAPGRNLNSQEGELPVAPSGLQAGP